MSYIAKPKITHPKLPRNRLGLTERDYEGTVSTLCAGCGHDSVTAALIQAVFELELEPHRLAKMSGIGCSSKTPAYFVSQSHGFNSVHGRMPSVTTGANAANRDLTYIGVSGDGDSLSIGMAQFAHVIRRNLDMCYIIENNGVYGLTKGQYSASADVGSVAKKSAPNVQMPIDPVSTAIGLGATYIARSFSGDKHDGSKIVFRKLDKDYDPTSREAAFSYLRSSERAGEIITGLLYIDEEAGDMHDLSGSVDTPLCQLTYDELNPGKETLAKLMARYR